jgi:hypothetical protein
MWTLNKNLVTTYTNFLLCLVEDAASTGEVMVDSKHRMMMV